MTIFQQVEKHVASLSESDCRKQLTEVLLQSMDDNGELHDELIVRSSDNFNRNKEFFSENMEEDNDPCEQE